MKRSLEQLADQTFDVLIIGGGIHGAVAAWDAALRGLSVALIERGDFGSGTSQSSLKTIHGGLRYLQDGNLLRIRTMARERTTWMKVAPHLVHPLTCLMPTRKSISRSRLIMGVALMANDILSFDRNRLTDPEKYLAGGRIISQQELSHLLPGYDIRASTGAAVWHDAQIHNSERLLLDFILSAADAGAVVANYVEATGLIQDDNRIIGIQAKDIPSGQTFDIRAAVTINCAGAWIDAILEKVSLNSEFATSVAMNVIIDQVWSGVAAGVSTQPANGKRSQILFIVPWRNKTMIGTWHIPWMRAPGEFKMNRSIVQDFLNEINSAHPRLQLSLNDVRHVMWGFLPIKNTDVHSDQVRLTRDGAVLDHHKNDGVSGLISVLGVKYTTARFVAEQAVNLAVKKLAVKAKKCQTHITPVKGGQIGDFKAFLRQAISKAPRDMDPEITEHLVYTHGSGYSHLVEQMTAQAEMAQRVDPMLPVTAAEVMHAVRDEMALTLSDVIQRRTELGATGPPSLTTLQKCADLIGCELGWSIERQQQEITSVIQAYPFNEIERVTA